MRRVGRAIATELVPVLLVLACLAGAWLAIVAMYRGEPTPVAEEESIAPATIVAEAETAPAPAAEVAPPPPPPPPEPPSDPTPEILAGLSAETARERAAASEADRRADALAAATEAALDRAESLRRRERIVTSQVAAMAANVRALEDDVDTMARWRDVLEQERDDLNRQLVEARSRDGYAVLPYKGPNGTWRRPIPIECRNGTATIQPGGPSFSLLELSMGFGRSSPLAAVLARYLDHVASGPSPDGAPVVPYVLFVVRPDGIRPYYDARSLLEPLGLTFGYELVEQDVEIEFPDLDDLAEWSETAPLRSRFAGASGWPLDPSKLDGPGGDGPGSEYVSHGRGTPAAADQGARAEEGDPGVDREGGRVVGAPRSGATSARGLAAAASGGPPESLVPSGGQGAPGGGMWRAGRSSPMGGAGASAREGDGRVPESAIGEVDLPREAPWPPVSRSLMGGLTEGPRATARPGQGGSGPAAVNPIRPAPSGGDRAASRALSAGSGGAMIGMSPPGATAGPPGSGSGRSGSGGMGEGSASTDRPATTMDLVVACRRDGVRIHPGGYRLSASKLEDGALVAALRGIVQNRQRSRPDVRWQPRVKFLVEPGGNDVYWEARRQTALSGLGWPVWLEVAEGTIPGRLLDPEVLR